MTSPRLIHFFSSLLLSGLLLVVLSQPVVPGRVGVRWGVLQYCCCWLVWSSPTTWWYPPVSIWSSARCWAMGTEAWPHCRAMGTLKWWTGKTNRPSTPSCSHQNIVWMLQSRSGRDCWYCGVVVWAGLFILFSVSYVGECHSVTAPVLWQASPALWAALIVNCVGLTRG